jgi:hypothetical protein
MQADVWKMGAEQETLDERIDRARRVVSDGIRNPTHRTYKPAAKGIPNVKLPNQRQRRRDFSRKGGAR